ncbi:MAG: tRNA (guanosine(37)-N1)-methyltransferase TrmD [Candidatus Latescibacterota bacterium]
MKANIITIFPEVMEVILSMGMLGVAKKKELVEYRIINPREFTKDLHRTVDDVPYGGGAGMVMMAPPIVQAVESLALSEGSPVILTSPAGRRFDHNLAHRYAACQELTFICGRYKGVDERVRQLVVTDELSIGDFILSGGELAAAVCIEAVIRLLDKVLGNEESRDTDSFEIKRGRILDCSYYTRPAEYKGIKVPDVLMSGNHKEIEKWRELSSLENTQAMRPDLLKKKQNG